METRFKKLLNRRSRLPAESSYELGPRDENQQPLSHASRPSMLHQSRTKSTQEASRHTNTHAPYLRSFSYDSVSAGKAPTMGTLPQKGNGPIKLQTSRRLSSGDLMATTQDSQTTLQDIREGDYIVGKKERPVSRTPAENSTPTSTTRKSILPSSKHLSSLTNPTSPTWSNTPRSVNPSMLYEAQDESSHVPSSNIGLGLSSPTLLTPLEHIHSYPDSPGSEQHAFRPNSTTLQPHSHSRARESATLEALRRAEYARLVETSVEGKTSQQLTQADGRHHEALSPPLSPPQQLSFPFPLEPPPFPYAENFDGKLRRGSDVSGMDSSCDGTSGQSSLHRASGVSSYDDSSSATAQTSLAEDDAANTADDIRKLVAQLRSNYLTALDARPLPPPLSKSQKKRRKMKSVSSPIIGSGEPLPSKASPTLSQGHGRQTWHPQNYYSGANPNKRMHSAPYASTNRLSPIRASSPQEDDDNVGIRRADSTTLGGLMAELTRSNVQGETALYSSNSNSQVCLNAEDAIFPAEVSKKIESEVSAQDTHWWENQASWLKLEPDSTDTTFLNSPADESPELQSEEFHTSPNGMSSIHRFPSLALSKAERLLELRHKSVEVSNTSGLWSPKEISHEGNGQRSSHLGNTYSTTSNENYGRQHRRHQSCTPTIGRPNYSKPDIFSSHTYSSSFTTTSNNVAVVGIPKPPGNFF